MGLARISTRLALLLSGVLALTFAPNQAAVAQGVPGLDRPLTPGDVPTPPPGPTPVQLPEGFTKLNFPTCTGTLGWGDHVVGHWFDKKGNDFEIVCVVPFYADYMSETPYAHVHYEFSVSFADGTKKKVDECEYESGDNDVELHVENGELITYYHANWSRTPEKENRDFHTVYTYKDKETTRIDSTRVKQPDGTWLSKWKLADDGSGPRQSSTAEFRNSGVLNIREFKVWVAGPEPSTGSAAHAADGVTPPHIGHYVSLFGPAQTMDAVTWDAATERLTVQLTRSHTFPNLSVAINNRLFRTSATRFRTVVDGTDVQSEQGISDDLILLNIPIGGDAQLVTISSGGAVSLETSSSDELPDSPPSCSAPSLIHIQVEPNPDEVSTDGSGTSTPPAKPANHGNDDSGIGDILGHVTVGVGVGGGSGGHDDHHNANHPDKTPKDVHPTDTPPSEAAPLHDP